MSIIDEMERDGRPIQCPLLQSLRKNPNDPDCKWRKCCIGCKYARDSGGGCTPWLSTGWNVCKKCKHYI